MTSVANKERSWLRHGLASLHEHRAAILALLIGGILTVAAFDVVRDLYRGAAQQEFDRQSGHYLLAIQRSVDRHAELMAETADRFAQQARPVDRWEFTDIAINGLGRHPGYKALAWAPLVSKASRPAYEQRAHEDGLQRFRFKIWDSMGKMIDAPERSEYAPIFYVEPLEDNTGLLGFDFSTSPIYAPAVEQARAAGETVVVDWVGASGQRPPGSTLLVIHPVRATEPQDAADGGARGDILGFAVGLMGMDSLVESTLREFTTPAWLDTFLFEEAEDGSRSLLHVQPSILRGPDQPLKLTEPGRGAFSAVARHRLANWNLAIKVEPVPGTMTFNTGIVPWGVALIGLLLTGVLSLYLVSSRNRQRVIEHAVTVRTAELLEANESNAALESEISERKRVERELRAAKEEAEVASRTKSEFLAMVSHELRTPLNAVIGFSEMLISEVYGPLGDRRYGGYAQDIRNSGQHLLGLINNILDLSKVEANKFQLKEEDVDVLDLVADSIHLVEGKAESMRITLSCIDENKTLPRLHADARALRQILLNLLSNAVKFTPPGGRVAVSARHDPEQGFVLSVADSGIGISEADIENVLKPFTQVDSSLSRKFEGTGLGLPLTKSLVELHGGRFEIESAPGAGTKVIAVFPPERVVHFPAAAE